MMTLEELFPPYGLRIVCGPLELRCTRDEDIPAMLEVIRDGIEPPDGPMPFLVPWHTNGWDPLDPTKLPYTSLQHWWDVRAHRCRPERWHLGMTVRLDGEVVGCQDVFTKTDFRKTRQAETGSWLGLRHQGKGTGTLMRQVVATFAFDHLGAEVLRSGYIEGNGRSAAVSRKTGYRDVGHNRIDRSEGYAVEHLIELVPGDLVRPKEPVEVSGVAALRRFLGIDHEGNPDPARGEVPPG